MKKKLIKQSKYEPVDTVLPVFKTEVGMLNMQVVVETKATYYPSSDLTWLKTNINFMSRTDAPGCVSVEIWNTTPEDLEKLSEIFHKTAIAMKDLGEKNETS